MDGVDDIKVEFCFVDAGEEADAAADEERGDVEGDLVDMTGLEVLADAVGAAGDADVFIPCRGFGLFPCAFDAIVYEVERAVVLLHPGFAFFVGEYIDRRLEHPLGPVAFAFFEHPFSHDPGACPGEDLADEIAVIVLFLAFPFHFMYVPECFLNEHPVMDGGALIAERVFRASVLAGHESVEGDADVDKCLAHNFCFIKGISRRGLEKYLVPTFNGCDCDKMLKLAAQ